MHDLINDLAISVAGEFFFMLDDKMDAYDRNEAFEKFRHFSFVGRKEVYRKFKELRRARPLRTFLPVWKNTWRSMSLLNKDFVKLLSQLQFVRVLSLAQCSITDVPRSISSLKHIRYLNFSRTSITCIPEEVSDLYNLQSLLVSGCQKLYCLPTSLVKVKNLRHLDTNNTPLLNKIPIRIGGLTSLQTLSKAIIEGGNGFKISELKDLLDLQGSLSIQGLHNVTNAREANNANLQQKKGLDRLVLGWSYVFDDSRNETAEYEVLTELRPHQKLRFLDISSYDGMKFPWWVGDPSFDQLTVLRLCDCRSCTYLPTLGHLLSLRELYVSGMDEVKTVGSEFLAPANCFHDIIAFSSLEVLKFENMRSWEIWSTSGGHKDGTAGFFPRLCLFSIISCRKLAQVPIADLNIEGFSLESYYCPNSVEMLEVCNCDSMTSLTFSTVQELPSSLKNLYIRNCGNLRSIHGGCLVHLTQLEIENCDNIKSIPEHVFDFPSMSCLRYLQIYDCKNLKSFPHEHLQSLASLEELRVRGCPCMDDSFPCGLWPPNLRILEIGGLKKPMSDWGLQNYPSSLVRLILHGENSGVVSFAEAKAASNNNNTASYFLLPSSLTHILIHDFMDLESVSVSEALQHLTCLKEFVFQSCPKLKDLPQTTSHLSSLKVWEWFLIAQGTQFSK